MKCVRELQGLNPRPVPIVSDNGNGIRHVNLEGLQKLYPHQHRDFNLYKELGKKHPGGFFFLQTSFSRKHFSSLNGTGIPVTSLLSSKVHGEEFLM